MNFVDTKLRSDAQVEQPCPELDPKGGVERLRASGVRLGDQQVENIRQSRNSPADATPLYVWPTDISRLSNSIGVVGSCPYCGFIHSGHGIPLDGKQSRIDLVRFPACPKDLPPFIGGHRPPVYRLVVILDVAPEDVRLEMKIPQGDLLAIIRMARREIYWDQDDTAYALSKFMESGVCEKILSNLNSDSAKVRNAVTRNRLGRLVKKHGPGLMRIRLARAAYSVARGNFE